MYGKGIYEGLDVQDAYVASDANEVGYKPRSADMDAHPMLVHGEQRKNGMLEGTHSILEGPDNFSVDTEFEKSAAKYIQLWIDAPNDI